MWYEPRHDNTFLFLLFRLFGTRTTKTIFGPGHAKMCLMPYETNKGSDQPAHPRSLISTFIVHCQDSIMPLVSISEI